MTARALRPCRWSGCAELTRDGYCPEHAKHLQRASDRNRGTATQRGYGSRWRRLRKFFLSRNPLCAECLRQGITTPATDVDHILARRRGGTDDWDNLQALCHSCHSRKTATEDGAWGRATASVDKHQAGPPGSEK